MKDEKILQDEILTDEELDKVAGGTQSEIDVDMAFFRKLGYNVQSVDDLYSLWYTKGFIYYTPSSSEANQYHYSWSQIDIGVSYYSHESALGRVLAGAQYPGFDYKKTHDKSYVRNFIKTNMGIDI
ncbi:MAG: hypothetical protein IK062_10995 [Selenomonadaceae bacterium]|nr:hypothetical protein [Selenomonadaceae bacterium]